MAKSKTAQRYILKLDSQRLQRSNFSINLTFDQAMKNNEVISISEGQTIRFIEKIIQKNQDINVFEKKKELISSIKNEKNKEKIVNYRKELLDMLFLEEYVTVKFKNKKIFREVNKNGFTINGNKYVRLLGTSGGIKKNTVVYVKESIHKELEEKIDNGRNKTKRVPAKLEAYRSLTCSSSTPVPSDFNFVVVNDFETTFKSKVTYIDRAIDGIPDIQEIDDYEINHTDSDGYGLISPRLAERWRKEIDGKDSIPTGFCIRNSYTKGMVFTFDIRAFAKEIAETDEITDIWGKTYKIETIDMIIPKSVFKLSDDYNNMQHYLNNCENNGYEFCVTKMISNRNDNVRNMNYQFIQSLDLNDADIRQLVEPTIKEFRDVMSDDYYKSLLFLTGIGVNENNLDLNNGWITALQIEPELFKDEFVKNKIHQMLAKKINDAKMGVISTTGNFSIISGDVYGFAESAFGMENPKGLLKEGEFYSNYWNCRKVKEVVGMRAPMTVDSNIRKLKLVKNDDTEKWYQYMKNCIILNAWDATCNTLNGADKDGDTLFTTDNPIIIKGTKELPPIICAQNTGIAKNITNKVLEKSNSDAFNDEIGSITNRGSEMTTLLASFGKDSIEYKTLYKRIQYTMKAQQDEIDAGKGIQSEGMPKEWFDYRVNKVLETDSEELKARKELNLKLLANKKPYYFIYNYSSLKREYLDYEKNANRHSRIRYGVDITKLQSQPKLTEDQQTFLDFYEKRMPVDKSPSVMNKLCMIMESEFNDYKQENFKDLGFDCSVLKSNETYTKNKYNKIKKEVEVIYKEYITKVQDYMKNYKSGVIADSKVSASEQRKLFVLEFITKCKLIEQDMKILSDIIIDVCYNSNKNKQFVWDICGEQIIQNLLDKHENKILILEQNQKGEVSYNGLRFTPKYIDYEVEDEINIERNDGSEEDYTE